MELLDSAVPAGLIGGLGQNPPLKRWAIVGRPSGTGPRAMRGCVPIRFPIIDFHKVSSTHCTTRRVPVPRSTDFSLPYRRLESAGVGSASGIDLVTRPRRLKVCDTAAIQQTKV